MFFEAAESFLVFNCTIAALRFKLKSLEDIYARNMVILVTIVALLSLSPLVLVIEQRAQLEILPYIAKYCRLRGTFLDMSTQEKNFRKLFPFCFTYIDILVRRKEKYLAKR